MTHIADDGAVLAPRSPQGRRRARRRLQPRAAPHRPRSPRAASRRPARSGHDRYLDRRPRRQHRHDLSSARASSDRATPPASCRSPARSSISTWASSNGRAARHQSDAGPGRHHFELLDPARRAAGARGGRGGPRRRCWRSPRRGSACRRAASTVAKGVVSVDGDPARSVDLWRAPRRQAVRRVKFTGTAPHEADRAEYKLVGTRVPRVDIPDKASGKYVYMQHVRVPDMLHGRVVRPRGQGAYGDGAKPLAHRRELDRRHPRRPRRAQGRLRRRRRAEHEWDAVKAARRAQGDLAGMLRAARQCRAVRAHARRQDDRYRHRRIGGDVGDGVCAAPRMWRRRLTAAPIRRTRRSRPTARSPTSGANGALVMSSTQDIYNSRAHARRRARAAGREGARAVLRGLRHLRPQLLRGCRAGGRRHVAGRRASRCACSSCAGTSIGWDNYGPAHLADVRAAIDAGGKIVAYEYHGWQHGWTSTRRSHELAQATPPKERTERPGVRSPSTG